MQGAKKQIRMDLILAKALEEAQKRRFFCNTMLYGKEIDMLVMDERLAITIFADQYDDETLLPVKISWENAFNKGNKLQEDQFDYIFWETYVVPETKNFAERLYLETCKAIIKKCILNH